VYLLIRYLTALWRRHHPSVAAVSPPGVAAIAHPDPGAAAGHPADRVRRPTAAARGPLALLAHQARYDLLASMRNPRARFFTFMFPILLLVIFASVFGNGTTVVDGVHVHLSRFYVPGIMTMSIITAAYAGLVISTATAREAGVLKRRRATPVPPAILIGGQAASTLVTAVIMSALLLVIARLGYGVGFAIASLGAIACAVVIGTLTFACLGYAVAGLIGSPDAAQPIVQATMLPLYFISGVWIPSSSLPHTLRQIAEIFPIEHLAAALHLASVRGSFSTALAPRDLLVLALWALGASALAARRFSWLPVAAAS
jgi:ABC-2 type transport system permease protein